MTRRRIISAAVLLALWCLAAFLIHNEILLPYPWEVGMFMLRQLGQGSFYLDLGMSLFRLVTGLAIAMLLGLVSGLWAGVSPRFEDFFYPVETVLKTVPNVSFLIIALIWLGSAKSVYLVVFLVLFPIFYANMKNAVRSIDPTLLEAAEIHQASAFVKIRKIYFPLSRSAISAALSTAAGLGFKVTVMAEVLSRVQSGIGFRIDFCRVNLDMTGVFAWTVWTLLLAFVFQALTAVKTGEESRGEI